MPLAIGSNILAAPFSNNFYRSTNDGQSWELINAGLRSGVYHRRLLVTSTHVYTGAYGSGVWRWPLSEVLVGVEEQEPTLPLSYTLEQNYPNPFNPVTTIRYTVGGNGAWGMGSGAGTKEAGARGSGLGTGGAGTGSQEPGAGEAGTRG